MKVLELFAGYGSQALALENLGVDFTSDISEIDKYAIQAYNQLHGATHNWGDVCKIDETQLPYYDLITYSSPCQDFSVAGLGKGGDIDSGTRSSLLWQCERIIRAVRPKYLLMENVKNLVGERHKHNFIKWLKVLESLGYQNFWKVLNAKDYGVPQNRERVFVVSILDGGQYLFPNPIKLEKRLKDVLESNVDEKYYLSEKLIRGFLHCQGTKNTGFAKNGINIRNDKEYATALTARMAKCAMTDNYIQEPLVCASRGRNPDNPSDRTTGSPTEQRIEINNSGCANTLTSVQKDNYVVEPQVIQIGNIVETDSFGGNPQCGRIYSDNGLSPTLNTMQGGGREPKIMCYDIPQTVTVRKHEVDINEFVRQLREHKQKVGISNKQIAESLNLPLTMVEHWFRTDNCFSVPDKDIWFKLKQLLKFELSDYDAFVTEFEEKEGTFEKANRCYGTDGIAPTMTAASSDEKIIHQYRIRKLTPRECWRLMGVKDEQFDKLHDLSNTQLYKMAGNSIVVDVLMGIFKNLLLSDEGTNGQLTLL